MNCCVCRYRFSLRTAGQTITEDRRHPQGRWSSVKDDLEGLRRSSNGNNSIICQLQLKIRHCLTHDEHEPGVFYFFVITRSPQSLWSWARYPQRHVRETRALGHTHCLACSPPTDPALSGPALLSSPSSKVPWHLPKWASSDYLFTFTG